jgi:ABC-type methionine transport system permease subunit
MVGRFNSVLAPALETALGGDLVVLHVREHLYRESNIVSRYISTIEYQIAEGQPVSDDLSAKISEALESLDGNITVHPIGTIALGSSVEGLKAGGVTGDVSITYGYSQVGGTSGIAVTVTVSGS